MGKDPTMVLGLIELKDGIVSHGQEVVRRVGDWRKGLSRYDRSQETRRRTRRARSHFLF